MGKITAFLVLVAVIFVSAINVYLIHENNLQNVDVGTSSNRKGQIEEKNIAMSIVTKAYGETFAHLDNTCKKTKELTMLECFNQMYQIMQGTSKNPEHIKSPPIPSPQYWWFQTMVRDGGNLSKFTGSVGLHAPWRVGQSTNPNVSMCMIEKNGLTQWRKVFQKLNNSTGQYRSDTKKLLSLPDIKDDDAIPSNSSSSSHYPSFVIIRDPLERFLSAYINKCVHTVRRKFEKHCEPNELYGNPDKDKSNVFIEGFSFSDDYIKPKEDVESKIYLHHRKKKAMFANYVDTMALKWNLHFFPQSIYCDGLYRFIDKYDLVVHMNSKFYHNLDDLGKKYGGRFEETLNEVFGYKEKLKSESSAINVGTETQATEKVLEYYTPRTLRRVLEYVSIDYKQLGLEIPDWAEAMLQDDIA